MAEGDSVADDETLYRAIQNEGKEQGWHVDQDGVLRFTEAAFLDPEGKPSVDRARLLDGDPAKAQKHSSDGVVALLARDVRAIDEPRRDKKGRQVGRFEIDVLPDPLPDNPAHAVVTADPPPGSNPQRRIRDALARLAQSRGWTIPPEKLRSVVQ